MRHPCARPPRLAAWGSCGPDRRTIGHRSEDADEGTDQQQDEEEAPTTTPPTSRSSKGSNRSASGRACTSAPPAAAACITSSTRSSTTRSTRRWPGTATRSSSPCTPTARPASLDNGRGIPVKPIPGAKDRRPAVEVVLTVLHAGGKFGGGGYAISGGLHGVGVSVVNALSEKLEVEVMRDGHRRTRWRSRAARSRRSSRRARPRRRPARGSASGPTPRSSPRRSSSSGRSLAERLQELAFLNKGVEIQLVDERDGAKEVFKANGGLVDFVKYLAQGKDTVCTGSSRSS